MEDILQDVKRALCAFSPSDLSFPPNSWVDQQAIALFQQYPSGISRTVLLTELEHRWRSSLKRGENAGKLKQAVSTLQLSLSDVLMGELSKVDEYRCVIQCDGVKCGMMVHRQLFDWTMFLQSVGVDALSGRTCMVTCCRMLNISPALLLPTPLLLFVLRMSDPLEGFLVQDVFLVLHQAFAQNFVNPYIVPHSAAPVWRPNIGYSVTGNCDLTLPDNSQTLVVLAEVLGNSAVRQYNAGAAGAVSADFQLVTLRLHTADSSAAVSSSCAGSSPCCIAYLILFDDQVSLSRMWSPGDLLLVYRPYLRANAEEEAIFGANRPGALDNPAHTLAYDVVRRADPGLLEHLPALASCAALSFVNYHLLYGSVTVISKIVTSTSDTGNATTTSHYSGAVAKVQAGAHLSAHSRLGPVMGRLIGVFEGMQPGGDARGGMVELWVQVLSQAVRCGAAASDPQGSAVLRVRFLASAHPALQSLTCYPGCTPSNRSGSVTEPAEAGARMPCQPIAQAGQLVSISGLTAIHLSTLPQPNWQHQAGNPPPGVTQYLSSAFPGLQGDVQVLNCVFTESSIDSADALFGADADCAGTATTSGVNVEVSESVQASASIVALCCLPALACSPSLLLPVSLRQAMALARTAACGCILVQASIQPLHPSVRLCCPLISAASIGTAETADPALKRARIADEVADNRETMEESVVMGYQLVRLRDGTGESLCVIESNVMVKLSGGTNSAATHEVLEVRHRLVNTTSSLYLDSSTGQLVRLQQPVPHSHASAPPGASAQQQFSMLLSRIDDGVDSAVLRAIAEAQRTAASKNGNGSTSGQLPVFRIESICDANSVAVEAVRAQQGKPQSCV